MSNLNTELLNTLLKNESVDEFFRQLLEDAINDLLQAELSACLGYEKYDSDGWGSGNSKPFLDDEHLHADTGSSALFNTGWFLLT